MKLKTDFVRNQFAAFNEPSLKRWAHFENAGGSYMSKQTRERLDNYHRKMRVQPYADYQASKDAGRAMDAGYQTMADLLNVPVDWVRVGPSTSANAYTLSHAFMGLVADKTNIIVTNQDHEANTGFWRRMAGVEVREWSVRKDGILYPEDLWKLVDGDTLFTAFTHASNIVGMINPVEAICAELRKRNVWSIVDGVSYVPHAWPDVTALGADVYMFSAYKTYGPHQGVMTVRPELAEQLTNLGHEFNAKHPRARLNPAGPDHAQVAGLVGIGDYVTAVYQRHESGEASLNEMARAVSKLQRKHETKHLKVLLDGLHEINQLRVIGPLDAEARVPTVALHHDELTGSAMAKALRNHGVMASGGDFYAPRVLRAVGIDPDHGVLRVSFVHYTKGKEIEKLLKALKAILK